MVKFSIRSFVKNLRYLGRYNLKAAMGKISYIDHKIDMDNCTMDHIADCINRCLDNPIYELPYLKEKSKNIIRPKIKNFEDTVTELIETKKSIIRFGDGEILLMNNQSIGFQKANCELSKKLKKIVANNDEHIMIAINYYYYYADIFNFLIYPKFVYRNIDPIRKMLNQNLNFNTQYYSAGFTSCYQTFESYNFRNFYEKIRNIYKNQDITVICGDKTFRDIDFNIFDCAKSVNYIYGPSTNALDEYDSILSQAQKSNKKNTIIALLGPTAKLLCYDLTKEGYRCLDLGHLAKDYDSFMKNQPRNKTTIGKFFED